MIFDAAYTPFGQTQPQQDTLGEPKTIQRPAVIVPLTGTTAQMILDEAVAGEAAGADVLEWRIDFMLSAHSHSSLADAGKEVILSILQATSIPLLLTIRTAEQGGEAKLSRGRYRILLAELLDVLMHIDPPKGSLGIDIEHWFDGTRDLALRARELGITAVVSHHDWVETPAPEVMEIIFDEMLDLPDVVAKLAVTALSDEDVTALLEVSGRVAARSGRPIIAIAMGDMGKRSRLEGWKYGSVATFATVDRASAPGQPTVPELREALGQESLPEA